MNQTALYVRVSTDKQEVESQIKALREYCSKSDMHIYHEYVDVISGKETSRPAFDQMFTDAHKKLFDIVLFWDMSRFSRAGPQHTLNKLHELELLKIGYKSYCEPYLDTMGEFADVVLAVLATVAKINRERISSATKRGLRGKLNVGKRGPDHKPRKWRCDKGFKREIKVTS